MQGVWKILVPTDFSETASNAFRYAIWLADHYQADVELVHVIYPEVQPMDFPVVVATSIHERIEVCKELLSTFESAELVKIQTTEALKNIPNIQSHVEIGAATLLISHIAEREQVDMIVMGTRGEHNRLEDIFGSVTTATIHRAKCPVFVIPENLRFSPIETVAFAADYSLSDPYHIWEASRLLHPFDISMQIVHIDTAKSKKPAIQLAKLQQFFAEQAPALDISFSELSGDDISLELENFVQSQSADILILRKPKRGFLERLFHKSVTRELSLHAKIPLLIVKEQAS